MGNQPETIKVATVALSFGSAASYASGVHKMIERETIDLQKVDLIIDASIDSELSINDIEVMKMSTYFAVNMSLSAVGVSVATDLLSATDKETILVVNGNKESRSLILVERCGSTG